MPEHLTIRVLMIGLAGTAVLGVALFAGIHG